MPVVLQPHWRARLAEGTMRPRANPTKEGRTHDNNNDDDRKVGKKER